MREFLDRTFKFVGDTIQDVGQELSSEGAHNYLWGGTGAVLGFILTQHIASGWFGGGFFSQLAAFPLAITGAVLGSIVTTKGVNAALDWGKENWSGNERKSPESENVKGKSELQKERAIEKAAAKATQECKTLLAAGTQAMSEEQLAACSVPVPAPKPSQNALGL